MRRALRVAAAWALAALSFNANAQEPPPIESDTPVEPRVAPPRTLPAHCPSDALIETGLLPTDVELAGACLLAAPRSDRDDADEIAAILGRGGATTTGGAAAVASGLLDPPAPPPEPEPEPLPEERRLPRLISSP